MNEYLNYVLKLAYKSLDTGDIPVGAIVVKDQKIIGEGFNTREKLQNVLGHAEVNAILMASQTLNNWNLGGCDLYVSLKPCSMCMEIIKQARISNVYYLLGKPENKHEFAKVNMQKLENFELSTKYQNELAKFFQKLREKN